MLQDVFGCRSPPYQPVSFKYIFCRSVHCLRSPLFRCLAGRLYNMPMQESFLMSETASVLHACMHMSKEY